MAEPRYSWSQPICERCYLTRYPGRQPTRFVDSDREKCVDCGWDTWVGIYYRIDPKTANFPTHLKDD